MKRSLSLIVFVIPFILQAQTCTCESNFNWMKQTFEENDAGFTYILEKKGQTAYESHNEKFIEKVKSISDPAECGPILYDWLTFFRSGHIGIQNIKQEETSSNVSTGAEKKTDKEIRKQFKDWEKLKVDLEVFENEVKTMEKPGFEGIWQNLAGTYTMGVKKLENTYLGFIIEADGVYWTEGQIKFRITEEEEGTSSVYYMKDHSARESDQVQLMGDNYLQMGNITPLKRMLPAFESDPYIDNYIRAGRAQKPYFELVNDNTSYLRIPSFSQSEKADIDKVISDNKAKILSTENFIIDILDNGGGSDASYQELLPILYTDPIRSVGVEFRSTPLNNQRMLEFINNPDYGMDEETKKWAKEAHGKLSKRVGEFVNLDSSVVSITRFDTVYPYPKNIGILINDGNASTAEQFLLDAKQSQKVKLFGATTFGALDISNMFFVSSPCEEFQLWYCLSRSMRIPGMTIDEKGIQPDYYIDRSVPKHGWIEFVHDVLDQ